MKATGAKIVSCIADGEFQNDEVKLGEIPSNFREGFSPLGESIILDYDGAKIRVFPSGFRISGEFTNEQLEDAYSYLLKVVSKTNFDGSVENLKDVRVSPSVRVKIDYDGMSDDDVYELLKQSNAATGVEYSENGQPTASLNFLPKNTEAAFYVEIGIATVGGKISLNELQELANLENEFNENLFD